jgi:general secretion pathway protein D
MTAQPDMLRNLEEVIRQVDVRRAQVLVEAIIVEVGETAGINLGVQWVSAEGGMQQFTNAGVPISTIAAGAATANAKTGTTTTTTVDPSTGAKTEVVTGGADPDYKALGAALAGVNGSLFGIVKDDWAAVLQAVKADTNSNILATPHLTTLDNQESYFIVGEEVPVETGTTQTTGGGTGSPFTTKERKEVGIKLRVTPQINEGNAVKLTIEQEVSSRAGDVKGDPIFNKREIKTTVMADDGMTVVLGGLIDEDVQESESKVPLLGDIPVLGHLFRSTSSSKRKRNLMVFIRPTIMRDGGVMSDISQRKYNYIRAKQLVEQENGIQLMPQTDTPELPVWGKDKELPPEIQQRLDTMDKGEKETGGNP